MRAANVLPRMLCMSLAYELGQTFGVVGELDDRLFDGLNSTLYYALRLATRDGLYRGLSDNFAGELHERLKAELGGQT